MTQSLLIDAEPRPSPSPQLPKISPHDHVVCLLCGWDGDIRSLRSTDGKTLNCPGGHPGCAYMITYPEFEDPAWFAQIRSPALIDSIRAKRKELKIRPAPGMAQVAAFEKKVLKALREMREAAP